jgi:flagellar basal-body rod modification protein FlgD
MADTASGIGSLFQTQTSSATKSKSLFSSSSDMYLQLFLTQLKNQDPTQPFDTAQMTEQLSQLNSSQQLIDTNKNLESLISINKSSQASSLATFINKDVEYLGDTFYMTENDAQKFAYIIPADIESSSIEIRNDNNDLVLKVPASKTAGNNEYTWDGKDSLGNQVPVGTYKVSVVTKDASDKFSTASTFLSGTVTGVDFASSKEPVLFIGDDKNRVGVDLSRISSVSEKSGTNNANNTNSNI